MTDKTQSNMVNMTLMEAADAVKGLFEVTPMSCRAEGKSFYSEQTHGGVTFYFDKRQYRRDEVVGKLSEYFRDKYITDGQCRIDNITLLWTNVYLEPVGWQDRSQEEKDAERESRDASFCEKWEKTRELLFECNDGSLVKVKDIPDDDLKAVVKRKLKVDRLCTYRIVQGEIMYRLKKGVYHPSDEIGESERTYSIPIKKESNTKGMNG